MIVVACLETVTLVVTVLLLLRQHAAERDAWARQRAAEHAAWAQERAAAAEERRTLCDRIQQPHTLPYRPVDGFELPEIEPDGWNQVGEIVIDPEYGVAD